MEKTNLEKLAETLVTPERYGDTQEIPVVLGNIALGESVLAELEPWDLPETD